MRRIKCHALLRVVGEWLRRAGGRVAPAFGHWFCGCPICRAARQVGPLNFCRRNTGTDRALRLTQGLLTAVISAPSLGLWK
jgi:hypothetical protein